MINFYIGEENLPKDKRYIRDPENTILMVKLCGTEFQKRVLAEIENGQYKNSLQWIDRFGSSLYYTDLSTGSKTLFALEGFPEFVIDCDECGENALKMISLLDNCNVYLSHKMFRLDWYEDKEVTCNNMKYRSISNLSTFLRWLYDTWFDK